jgi:general L-amino acid transport system permease protein
MPISSPIPLQGQVRRPGPRFGLLVVQAGLAAVICALICAAAFNVAQNLSRAHIASGFGFWNNTAGFDISQTLIGYSANASTFGRAFWVGLLNTLVVAALGIVFATVIGFPIGLGRLSSNWLVARLSGGYVEIVRNVPLLLQLLFWYNAVLETLPDLRGSVRLPGGAFLNNRGLFLPRADFGAPFAVVLIAIVAAVAAAVTLRIWARRRFEGTGQSVPVAWPTIGLLIGCPLIVLAIAGVPLQFDELHVSRFNISGGVEILPEFAALVVALSIYTAAFIAEVVRAGVLAVERGQLEAAQSLGLRPNATLRLIVIPQAMRVIIPPLTSQYLNLLKNSSLAVAIGYPDLVEVFAGSVLNITGQAVEVIAVTMAVYLAISLFVSLLMNLYARRVSMVDH